MYCVYIIINKVNDKKYVGCTEKELAIRLQKHVGKANEGSACSIHKAIRKYGKENFEISLVEEYLTRAEMLAGEIKYIADLDTYKSPNGYNDTVGGEGGDTNSGKKFSEEWKLGMSKASAGKNKIDMRRFTEEIEREICRLYVDENKSTYFLGKQFNCQRTTIADILKRHGIEIRKSNYTGHNNGKNLFSIEQEIEICEKYLIGNISRSELARQYNCGKTTVREILLRHNIKL